MVNSGAPALAWAERARVSPDGGAGRYDEDEGGAMASGWTADACGSGSTYPGSGGAARSARGH
jgi:hypothetical protein